MLRPHCLWILCLSLSSFACGGGGSPAPAPPQSATATPRITPAAGDYASAPTVAIVDDTAGAAIYYTTDGSTPTTRSAQYAAPFALASDAAVQAIAVADGHAPSAVASAAYRLLGAKAEVVYSAGDRSSLMASQSPVDFTRPAPSASRIVADESIQYQTIEGFGASTTDSSAYLLRSVASAGDYNSIMNDLFTRQGSGVGLGFLRSPMGASDLARTLYSYDDQPAGATDPTLAGFSVAHDQADILPVILKAQSLNPDLKLMVNPWSPPAWMKTNGSMHGVANGVNGSLDASMRDAFARYFVKFVQAYQAAGVRVDYVGLQNEPLYMPGDYPGMGMSADEQTEILRDHVLPAFAASGLRAKFLVYDHNWDAPDYPKTVLGDATLLASDQVAGVAWHGYGGAFGAQTTLRNLHPSKGQYMTEHSGGQWVSNQFKSDFEEITAVMRNWGRAYVKWGLALDQNMGPHDGGCGSCTPIVTVNSANGAVSKTVEYYTLGHFSKYILPGAARIHSTMAEGLVNSAYRNADGSKVLVVFNETSDSRSFQVAWGSQGFSYTLPGNGAATFLWRGDQDSAAATPATNRILASGYFDANGVAAEMTGDANGGYDLGYIADKAYAAYKRVDFGGGVVRASLRVASEGGGAAELHLDSPSGATIATFNIAATGGWQTWTTLSAPVSGASGVHDLYVVFKGSDSAIANFNWIQFAN